MDQDENVADPEIADRVTPKTSHSTALLERTPSLLTLLIGMIFLCWSFLIAPVPGVNEPHYISKACHFWNPAYCPNDFFLESANPHALFYLAIGWLTLIFPLDLIPYIGRVIAYGLLAWGWTRALAILINDSKRLVLATVIFLLLVSWGNLSGEWIIGGVESKVFAYALLLAAVRFAHDRQLIAAGILAGLGVGMHAVVGVWAILAATGGTGFAWVVRAWLVRATPAMTTPDAVSTEAPAIDRQRYFGLAAFLIAVIPGLMPAILLVLEPVSKEVQYEATYLMVFFRLAHHLDPMTFSRIEWCCYGAMLLMWLMTLRNTGSWRRPPDAWWVGFVLATVVFAVAGLMIGWGPRPVTATFVSRGSLLKFYPFRLADLSIPAALAIAFSRLLPARIYSRSAITFGLTLVLMGVGVVGIFKHRLKPHPVDDDPDFIAACEWIRHNLPNDALVQSPSHGGRFKWLARRAEYVSRKDVPQDAVRTVEWNRRLNFLRIWYADHRSTGRYEQSELAEFSRETGITHVLTSTLGPFDLKPVHTSGHYQVFELPR